MNKTFTSILLGGSFLLLAATAQGAVPVVYPTPQQCQMGDATTRVEAVSILLRQPDSSGGLWDRLPADKEGAYALEVADGRLSVYANTEVGIYYAKQTLSQLLHGVPGAQNAQQDPFPEQSLEEVARLGELPVGTLVDWPDLPFRGAVEGYYGMPWSFEARLSQFAFYGRNKMNMYIYAPKDDPYHHGRGCYEPYPEAKAQEIKALADFARRNHVRFVWAIHPANTINWQEEGGRVQLEGLCRKLQLMYELGVRDFAVLVDDSSGEIGRAERQVQLCNYILENFIRRHADVNQTLIMCPTGYNRSWTTPQFLQTLGNGLDKGIPIMWTGDTVVHDITLAGQQWVNALVNRPTFIWWNWPCNDFKRGRLSMGRTYGLGTEPEMRQEMSGFVANPMEHAEASKVGLFGVADYTWNIAAFQSERSWKDGIARLYPGCADAMQVFCNHNSYLLPNNHGYFREESVAMAPVADSFKRSLGEGRMDAEAAGKIKEEFLRMEQAGQALEAAKDIAAFQQDAAPWLRQFTLTGSMGASIMDALAAGDNEARMRLFFKAVDTLSAMKRITRTDWNGGQLTQEKDVEVAMYAMVPAAQAAFRKVNADIYAEIAGRSTAQPVFSSNAGNPGQGYHAIYDGNMATFWSSETAQQAGQWFCLDFGQPTVIRNILLAMGGTRAQDYVRSGQFEISMDGEDWLEIGREMGGHTLMLNLARNPIRTRFLRYRITEDNPKWTSICMFGVNCIPPTYVSSNMPKRPDFSVSRDNRAVRINRVMEVFPFRPSEFIELELPAAVRPDRFEINVEDAALQDWAKIELTLKGGKRVQVQGEVVKNRLFLNKEQLPDSPVTAVRLTNAGKQVKEIKLTLFRLGLQPYDEEADPAVLTDGDLATFYDCSSHELETELTLPVDTHEIVVVGTAFCELSSARLEGRTAHLQRFALEPGTRSITLKVPRQEGARIHEIIFK